MSPASKKEKHTKGMRATRLQRLQQLWHFILSDTGDDVNASAYCALLPCACRKTAPSRSQQQAGVARMAF